MSVPSLRLAYASVLRTQALPVEWTGPKTHPRRQLARHLYNRLSPQLEFAYLTRACSRKSSIRSIEVMLNSVTQSVISKAMDQSYSCALAARKADMMLPEYVCQYFTLHGVSATVLLHMVGFPEAIPAQIDFFASLVRQRQLVVSMWVHLGGPSGGHISESLSEYSSRIVSLIGDGSQAEVVSEAGETYSLLGNKRHLPADYAVPVGATLSDLFQRYTIAAENFFDPLIHIRAPAYLPTRPAGEPDPDRFAGIIAALRELVPGGFNASRDLFACQNENDWHCAAASFLPYILGPADGYFPDYLHQILGKDLIDIKGSHYFIGPRVILALSSTGLHDENGRHINLLTWTQMLCEIAAIQLDVVRKHNSGLDRFISQAVRGTGRSKIVYTRKLTAAIDLEEYYNISVSKNPIFWRHLETLKEMSGIVKLQAAVDEKFSAVIDLMAHRERRVLSLLAQVFAVIFGAASLGRFIIDTINLSSEEPGVALSWTLSATGVIAVFCLLLVLLISRRT